MLLPTPGQMKVEIYKSKSHYAQLRNKSPAYLHYYQQYCNHTNNYCTLATHIYIPLEQSLYHLKEYFHLLHVLQAVLPTIIQPHNISQLIAFILTYQGITQRACEWVYNLQSNFTNIKIKFSTMPEYLNQCVL